MYRIGPFTATVAVDEDDCAVVRIAHPWSADPVADRDLLRAWLLAGSGSLLADLILEAGSNAGGA